MRIGILGCCDSTYVRQLLDAARRCSQVTFAGSFGFSELSASIGAGLDVCQPAELDAVIVRTMPLGTLEQVIFRMDCLQWLEHHGTRVVNSPRSLEVAIDKWLTLHRLSAAGIQVPRTVTCQNRDTALDAFEILGGDVLVKPLFGGEGRGIVRVSDRDMAWRVFSSLQQLGNVLYVQEFLEHLGYDIRVLFIGDRHFSIRRVAVGDAWRTNISRGSLPIRHSLMEEELDIARRAAQAVGGDVLGIDLLPCKDGRYRVLEVNAVPGWNGVSQALDADISQLIIAHVCDQVGNR